MNFGFFIFFTREFHVTHLLSRSQKNKKISVIKLPQCLEGQKWPIQKSDIIAHVSLIAHWIRRYFAFYNVAEIISH